MFKDFSKFILKGNIVDLMIGFTVGAAFSGVAKSFVEDILMPPVGVLLGQADFSNLFLVLKSGTTAGPYQTIAQAKAAGAVTMNYGAFINTLISLLIVGFAVFLLIKFINKINDELEELPLLHKKKKGVEEPSIKKCPFCLTAIPFRAIKCPACTADQPKLQEKK